MQTISITDLGYVQGGAGGNNNSFGRCGPGSALPFLGNYYTPECRAHDAAVRGAEAAGDSKFMAHLKALPQLPAAVGSWFRARFGGG